MKRHILTALLILLVLPSTAGEKKSRYMEASHKNETAVSWGFMPTVEEMGYSSYFSSSEGGLDNIYNNYMAPGITSGLISIDYNIHFRKWFTLGVQANGTVSRHKEMSSITGSIAKQYTNFSLSSLAYARFTYMRTAWVTMYGAIGLGIKYTSNGTPDEIHILHEYDGFGAAYQIAPFGITIGKRIYGMCEYGFGSEYMGLRIGIGYRF